MAANSQLPVEKERYEHLRFKNEALGVVEHDVPAGESTLEHWHTHDSASVCLTGSGMRTRNHGADWGGVIQPCSLGQIIVVEYATMPTEHIVQNIGSGVFHTFSVDNMRDSGWSTDPPDPSVAGLLVKETRAFLIYDVLLNGKSGDTRHVHTRPTIAILVSGHVTMDKQKLDRAGQWILIPAGVPHHLSASDKARVIEIEVR